MAIKIWNNPFLLLLLALAAKFVQAQGTTTRYVYDDNGRLRR